MPTSLPTRSPSTMVNLESGPAAASSTAGNEMTFEPLHDLAMMPAAQFEPLDMASYLDPSNNAQSLYDATRLPPDPSRHVSAAYQPSESASSLTDRHSPSAGRHHRLSIGSGIQQPSTVLQDELVEMQNAAAMRHVDNQTYGQQRTLTTSPINEEHYRLDDLHDAAPPAWSELKTKAGKERKRLPLACIACRRKKIRCSGEKPACKHCLRSRIPCVYKVTTRKAAPRTDYMAMLDKRLKRMEERVIKIIPKEEQSLVSSTGRAAVKPPLPSAPLKSTTSNKKRQAEHAFGDEFEEWASSPPTEATPKDESLSQAEPDTLNAYQSEEKTFLSEGKDKLPPKDLQEHLAEVFFDHVYGQSYHLLHKPSFMRKLAQDAVPPVLILAVCAISARFSNHPSLRTEPVFLRGEEWAAPAREIGLKRYDTPNITILIVYLILGLHEFGTCQGGRSWMFGGMAQRMAYALQLHKDLDHDPKKRSPSAQNELTFTDREIRRRTMWSCFIMDRFNSSGTDRPIFVGEQYIRAQLPIKEKYFQMEVTGPTEDLEGQVPNPAQPGHGEMADARSNMGVAAFLIRLVSIYGRLITYQNQGGKELDEHPMWSDKSTFQAIKRTAEQWRESLPSSLIYTPENLQNHASEKIASQFLFLHIVYHQILLFMNRFALPTPGSRPSFPQSMPEPFIHEASRTALESACRISELVHEAMDHPMVAPFAGYAAFASSTIHIYGAFSKDAEVEASSKQNLAWNVKYLTKMTKYWGMFHFVTKNLRDLYRRFADAVPSNDNDGENSDQAIFQYGDWFDRYPHGVVGSDFKEPRTEVKKEAGSDAVLGQTSDLQTVEQFFSNLSPPAKSAQVLQQQQQQQGKKTAKRRRASKLETNRPTQASKDEQPDAIPQQVSHDSAPTQVSQDQQASENVPQQSTAFPTGFQQLPNPLLVPPSQPFMSQLDRQMVLNSYSGLHANIAGLNQSAQQNINQMLADPGTSNLGGFDTNTYQSNGQNGNSLWIDPMNAWFMPFNMEPPAVGVGNHTFGREFDWSNNLGGFGDVVLGNGPNGLAMQPPMEMDLAQEDPAMLGMNDMNNMQ